MQPSTQPSTRLDHIAITVKDIASAIDWYVHHWQASLAYEDDSWALLQFQNINLALVLPQQHPPHIALKSPNARDYGQLVLHRDGSESCYLKDPSGNIIEVMQG